MKKIYLIHPDMFFAEYLRQYLEWQGFEAQCADSNVEGFTACVRFEPDLIILNKDTPYLDAMGFLIKKRLTEKLKDVPAFVIGGFSPRELDQFAREGVKEFLDRKVSPRQLTDRIERLFSIPQKEPPKRTPMLMDIHTKGKIIIVQIEGNLEGDKLIMLSYLIRVFCRKHDIKIPKLLLIIPSLYPESITRENLELLFSFRNYPEFTIEPDRIQVLTQNKEFLETMRLIPECSGFALPKNYYEGFKSLYIDMDIETRIPVDFIKPGNQYILDIFDDHGTVVLQAMQTATEEFIASLRERGIRSLKYYSDIELGELRHTPGSMPYNTVFDYITRTSEPIDPELLDVNIQSEKRCLFFRNARGERILFISADTALAELVKHTLGSYFVIDRFEQGAEIVRALKEYTYITIFIDLRFPAAAVLKLLQIIRSTATRTKTTIILLAEKIDKAALLQYKTYGTDHVILAPFTSDKLYEKMYQAVSEDRTPSGMPAGSAAAEF
jgi:DNA-binding response OmpR family regulator